MKLVATSVKTTETVMLHIERDSDGSYTVHAAVKADCDCYEQPDGFEPYSQSVCVLVEREL